MSYSSISGPSVWLARDMEDPAVWSIKITDQDAREIERLADALRSKGKSIQDVLAEDFQISPLKDLATIIRREIEGGRGVTRLHGLPVERMGVEGAAVVFWGLGSLLGTPLPQNHLGERLYAIQDERSTGILVLSSKTNVALPWHTDSGSGAFANAVPDFFGLFAVRTAHTGGTSQIISAHTIYNEVLRRSPECLHRLFRAYCFDRSLQTQPDQQPFTWTPIFEWVDGMLGVRYNRQRIERGHELAGVPLEEEDDAALDRLDEVLADPELPLSFNMEVGDALFTNNRTTVHKRAAFADGDTPEQKRLLYRLWIQRTR